MGSNVLTLFSQYIKLEEIKQDPCSLVTQSVSQPRNEVKLFAVVVRCYTEGMKSRDRLRLKGYTFVFDGLGKPCYRGRKVKLGQA